MLMPHDSEPFESEECVRKLLTSAVPPTGPGPDGSSRSSSMHGQWSATVARAALDVMSFFIDVSPAFFAAAAKHVGLLLATMQNTQHLDVADMAADFALQIARGGQVQHICTPQNLGKLLGLLQPAVQAQLAAGVAVTAAEILSRAVHPNVGLRLLAEQGCNDALVRATQHPNDEMALPAAQLVMKVTASTLWKRSDPGKKS
ncbi:hypothetical protein COO60DRAFT_1460905 [Scenedesmus sp. NREL 46B-D3]|nr:hypothetical protein COO60DRAFT_1460905 [Scenedesmus sp. NREL 46B-D3]